MIQYYVNPSGKKLEELSTHKVRFILFEDLADHSKPFYIRYATLKRFLTNDARNNALYYDDKTDRWPHEQFTHSYVASLYNEVRGFVREVKGEVK